LPIHSAHIFPSLPMIFTLIYPPKYWPCIHQPSYILSFMYSPFSYCPLHITSYFPLIYPPLYIPLHISPSYFSPIFLPSYIFSLIFCHQYILLLLIYPFSYIPLIYFPSYILPIYSLHIYHSPLCPHHNPPLLYILSPTSSHHITPIFNPSYIPFIQPPYISFPIFDLIPPLIS
jgi:hypothetical protein